MKTSPSTSPAPSARVAVVEALNDCQPGQAAGVILDGHIAGDSREIDRAFADLGSVLHVPLPHPFTSRAVCRLVFQYFPLRAGQHKTLALACRHSSGIALHVFHVNAEEVPR